MFARILTLTVCVILLLTAAPLAAQDDLEPVRVEVEAGDGVGLVGNYFLPPASDAEAPAVLLLHMLGSRKEAWDSVIPDLHAMGYHVLAVDQRGHGETPGVLDIDTGDADVQSWLDWLVEQPGVDPQRLNIVGGSIGANFALRGMAHDERVVTAVALSPGLTYNQITTDDAIETIGRRPVMLVSGQSDSYSAESVKALTTMARGDVLTRLYATTAHGTGLFMVEDDLLPSIILWLDLHNG